MLSRRRHVEKRPSTLLSSTSLTQSLAPDQAGRGRGRVRVGLARGAAVRLAALLALARGRRARLEAELHQLGPELQVLGREPR